MGWGETVDVTSEVFLEIEGAGGTGLFSFYTRRFPTLKLGLCHIPLYIALG